MLDQVSLKRLINQPALSRFDALLLCLATLDASPKTVSEVRTLATGAGLRKAKSWNISDILGRSRGLAIRTDDGWELSAEGMNRVWSLAGPLVSGPAPAVATKLRAELARISDSDTARFVEEAVSCFEAGHLRAAVVLSWVGAVSLLYQRVLDNHIAIFNREATRRNSKWKKAKSRDDLARMKEHDFLNVLEAISVIGRSVKQELEGCLKLRNGCGHPNSLRVGEHRVTGHLESLILNVFNRS